MHAGPNEIAIFTADALDTMDKPKSPFTRAPFYDFMLPEISLETTRSVKVHDWRRKIWNQALTDNSIASPITGTKSFTYQLYRLEHIP